MRPPSEARAQKFARELRKAMTEIERTLWQELRRGKIPGVRFRRQVPIGPFIADFLCVAAKLVVEVDGGQHADRTAYDAARSAYLERMGLRVLRFWNSEVLTNRDGVCLMILEACGGAAAGSIDPAEKTVVAFLAS